MEQDNRLKAYETVLSEVYFAFCQGVKFYKPPLSFPLLFLPLLLLLSFPIYRNRCLTAGHFSARLFFSNSFLLMSWC